MIPSPDAGGAAPPWLPPLPLPGRGRRAGQQEGQQRRGGPGPGQPRHGGGVFGAAIFMYFGFFFLREAQSFSETFKVFLVLSFTQNFYLLVLYSEPVLSESRSFFKFIKSFSKKALLNPLRACDKQPRQGIPSFIANFLVFYLVKNLLSFYMKLF